MIRRQGAFAAYILIVNAVSLSQNKSRPSCCRPATDVKKMEVFGLLGVIVRRMHVELRRASDVGSGHTSKEKVPEIVWTLWRLLVGTSILRLPFEECFNFSFAYVFALRYFGN